MFCTLHFIFACFIIAKINCIINMDNEPSVQIKNGMTIFGRVKKTIDFNKKYYSFYAIPFAEPPVGDFRFRAPVPLSGDQTKVVINSTSDSPSCLQIYLLGFEDCLYLNVYVPDFDTNLALFPVMVWLYGGAFIYGDNHYSLFGPDFLLNENVIVVTVNYRLGVFGFLSTDDESSIGNYGLKDQILALQWVHENIIYFNGNPDRVTLFGESAGSTSVSYLSQFSTTKDLFHGAIMQSGTSLCSWSLQQDPYKTAFSIASLLGVNTSNTQTLVNELRQINDKKLQLAQLLVYIKDFLTTNVFNGLPSAPSSAPSDSGGLITQGSYELLKEGKFHTVPYMLGYNSLEGIAFAAIAYPLRDHILKKNELPDELLPIGLHIYDPEVRKNVNNVIKNYYFGEKPANIPNHEILEFVSDMLLVRGITKSAILYSAYAPVYFYVFSYQGLLGSGLRKEKGVAHTDELPYLWNMQSKILATSEDLKTRYRMVRLWTNFAKYGNPTPFEDIILENTVWPVANSENTFNLKYLNISNTLNVSTNPHWDAIQFWENLFKEYGNPPYTTF